MVNIARPATAAPTYVKVANFPGLYRHSRSGRYYACKKLHGVRRERSLETCDRKIAERRLKEWVGNLEKVDAEVEKTTLAELIERYHAVTASLSESSRATDRSIIKKFLAWWPHGRDCQVRQIRPSMLDEWLAHEAPRLRNVSYNGYTGFLKQLFAIAVKDRVIAESPAASLRVPWKRPQTPKRLVPTVEQFEAIIQDVRSEPSTRAQRAEDGADFLEFLGLAGVGQAEASSLTWGDIDWQRNRMYFRRHKTDTHFYVPIYAHLRPLLVRLKGQARGRASDSARVFKIKDAKKALSAACMRLNLPHFSQRNLRQSLIRRLIRAKVDVKSISKWQGHQDGGQLILDTYTEVFGDDDDMYEQAQLAKISSGAPPAAPIAQFCGESEVSAPSVTMKKRMRKARPRKPVAPAITVPPVNPVSLAPAPAVEPAGATTPVSTHEAPASPAPAGTPVERPAGNLYHRGDKVTTTCKGIEVEAEVTAVFKDEVQVRTPDGELRWRTVRTVQR